MPKFTYSPWRHGGWYVNEVRYASGAVGCVSRNYADRKWRIACDPRPFAQQPTFRTRDEAAAAEYALTGQEKQELLDTLEACVHEYLQVDVVNGKHGPATKAMNLLREHGRDLAGRISPSLKHSPPY